MKPKSKIGEVRANDAAKVAEATASLLSQLNDRLDVANDLAEKHFKLASDQALAAQKAAASEVKSQKTEENLLSQHQKEYKLSLELKKQKAEELQIAKNNQRAMTGKIAKSTGVGITTFGDRVQGIKDTFKGLRTNTISTIGKMAGISENGMLGGVLSNRDAKRQYIRDAKENDPNSAKLSNKELGERYGQLQKLGKQKIRHEAEISRLTEAGFDPTNSKAAQALATTEKAMIATGDVRFKTKATDAEAAREKAKAEPTGIQRLAETEKGLSGAAQEEVQDEANDLVKEQTTVLQKILEAVGGPKEVTEKKEDDSKGGFLSGLKDMLSSFAGLKDAIGLLGKLGPVLGKLGALAGPAAGVAAAGAGGYMVGQKLMQWTGQTDENNEVKAGSTMDKATSWLAEKTGPHIDTQEEQNAKLKAKVEADIKGGKKYTPDAQKRYKAMGITIPDSSLKAPDTPVQTIPAAPIGKDGKAMTEVAPTDNDPMRQEWLTNGMPMGSFEKWKEWKTQADALKAKRAAEKTAPVEAPKATVPVEVAKPQAEANARGEKEYFDAVAAGDMATAAKTAETLGYIPKKPATAIPPTPQMSKAVGEKSSEVEAAKTSAPNAANNNVAVVNNAPTVVQNNNIQPRKEYLKGDRSSSTVGKNLPGPPR